MKAVAAALVLIAGAAVVLWYGNTLSSWVLGGLIGGLAALLLSIPISLTLFSFFSRRHDARLRAEAEEEKALAHMYDYAEPPQRMVRPVYDEYEYEEVERYVLPPAGSPGEEESYHRRRATRNLPVPSKTQLPMSQRGRSDVSAPRLQAKNAPLLYSKDSSGRRTPSRRMNYPGFPGYEPGSSLSQHRTAALRMARQEAARQDNDDGEDMSTSSRRSHFASRSGYAIPEAREDGYERSRRPSRSLEQPDGRPNYYRSRRTVDSSPSQNGSSRSLPAKGESTASRRASRRYDPPTEYLEDDYYQQTEGLSRSYRTGAVSRRAQPTLSSENLDPTTDDLQRPLVRRAPYTYEDDPLRRELSKQVDTPPVRRSSLYHLDQHLEDEDY
jgi:hypothetical protein